MVLLCERDEFVTLATGGEIFGALRVSGVGTRTVALGMLRGPRIIVVAPSRWSVLSRA
jgi:hypothetical protein